MGTFWNDDNMLNLDWNHANYINIHISSNYTLKVNSLYVISIMLFLKLVFQDWKDGSVVKSSGCSCNGPRFCSQNSQADS